MPRQRSRKKRWSSVAVETGGLWLLGGTIPSRRFVEPTLQTSQDKGKEKEKRSSGGRRLLHSQRPPKMKRCARLDSRTRTRRSIGDQPVERGGRKADASGTVYFS